MTYSELYGTDPRRLSRHEFGAIRRAARMKCLSVRVGDHYIGRGGCIPCDGCGNIVRGVWYRIRFAQYNRRKGWKDGARQILKLA